ncbi:MAG: hypothetical protein K2O14_09815 [Oscillospiraceae bacterium]|nr:hypothetical protein [Oscillospiraceae bacterium]
MKSEKKIAKWLKEYGPSILITVIIAVLVFLSQFPYLAGIISYVAVDGILGYWYRNKIISEKARLKLQVGNEQTEPFNSDYFDLYHEYNYNQWMVALKAACLAFSLCPIIHDFLNEELSYITIGMGLAVIFFSMAIIASTVGKRSKVFVKLHKERKDNWFGEYTEKEIAILCQSEDCGEKMPNK